MKLSKLHIKTFSIALLILVAVEIVIFILLSSVSLNYIRTTAYDHLAARSEKVKHLLENELRIPGLDSSAKHMHLQSIIEKMEKLYLAKVCLLFPDGDRKICSSEFPVPVVPVKDLKQHKTLFYKRFFDNEPRLFYAHLPITFPGNKEGALIAVFDLSKFKPIGAIEKLVVVLFFLYLVGIGVGTAFLLFPLSLFITRPIRVLRDSAGKIAGGDLAHRITTKSNDEIGELGNAFNQMADSLEKMVEETKELSANISHELRSPLARIRIALELIRDNLSGESQNKSIRHLNAIETEIEGIDGLIGRILLLSKLDAKKLSLKMEMVDIAQLTNDMLERFSSAIQKKSILLSTMIPENCPSIPANPDDIHMAMSNLLDNAIKYTPDHGTLEVQFIYNNGHFEISIANSCDTLSRIDFSRLFEPFYRPEKMENTGSGLGLKIAEKIINHHQGDITVQPWNDKGIKFNICFKV